MSKSKSFGDMPAEEFKKYGYELIDWVANYLENVGSFPVLPNIKPGEIKSHLPVSAPKSGEDINKIIADVDKIILPGTTHWQHPNFMAYFNSSASGPGILAELLSAAFNVNGMVWKSAPASTELEETVLSWFRELMNLPKEFKGIIYDTASVSSMHAIASARESIEYDIRKKGMSGAPKLKLYCSEHAHSSIDKGALTLGIGLDGIRKIPVDSEFKMIPSELETAIKEDRANGFLPFCVVATIGTTSTTSVDPVDEIATICEREKIWLHVDGAHAGVTAMLPEMNNHFKDLERADSFVVNPHKWLFVPVDLSILFTRKPEVLKEAFSLVAEYLKTAEDSVVENYMDYGIQLGRRFRSLKLWFVLRYFGVEGLQSRLREHIRLGQLFAKWIDVDQSFERLAPTPFSTICFRAKPVNENDETKLNELNETLMNAINSTGKVFLTHTKLNRKFTIRLVISGLRTEEKHVELAWKVIHEELNKILLKEKSDG
ncbi:MAG: pyridoxal-dependent decarboxylase [Ignavibacteriales bacterium]|nr:pyridoxal-dependent decarboxylase [Ignavibacteriales bacterium]